MYAACEVGPAEPVSCHGASCRRTACFRARGVREPSTPRWGALWEDLATSQCLTTALRAIAMWFAWQAHNAARKTLCFFFLDNTRSTPVFTLTWLAVCIYSVFFFFVIQMICWIHENLSPDLPCNCNRPRTYGWQRLLGSGQVGNVPASVGSIRKSSMQQHHLSCSYIDSIYTHTYLPAIRSHFYAG